MRSPHTSPAPGHVRSDLHDADLPGAAQPARPRVGLIGYYGWGNFGDELMRQVWTDALEGHATSRKVHSLLQRPYFQQRATDVADSFDHLLIGGGDLIRPRSISSLYWNRAWVRRPVTVSGVGVALEEDRLRPDVLERLHAFFRHSSIRHVSARDAASAGWIQEHLSPSVPVRVTADLAFAAQLPPAAPRQHQTVGVVLRKEPSSEDVAAVRRVSNWAHRHGFSTEFLVLATGATREQEAVALRTVFGPDAVVRTADTVGELAAAVSRYGVLFTAKFHGAVVAYRYGVPPLSLRPTHKIQALAGALKDPALTAWSGGPDSQLLRRAQRTLPASAVAALEESARDEVASVVASFGSATIPHLPAPVHDRKQPR